MGDLKYPSSGEQHSPEEDITSILCYPWLVSALRLVPQETFL